MTIEVSQSFENFLNGILPWIESHSVTVVLITPVIAGFFGIHKFIRKKRAEASFGFYARLLLRLKYLRTWLDDKNLLETDNPQSGNIYALIYIEETQKRVCPGFHVPSGEELNELKRLVSELKETMTGSDSNVYPKASDRTHWYNSQQVLYEFCEFIEYDSERRNTNIAESPENADKYKHTTLCEKLAAAMNYIKESIENEN